MPDIPFRDPEHGFTRDEALRTGLLVDVSEIANEFGWRIPTHICAAFWHNWIVPDEVAKQQGQTLEARVAQVLLHCRCAALENPDSYRVRFSLVVSRGQDQLEIDVLALAGPDDEGLPCLTIMIPEDS